MKFEQKYNIQDYIGKEINYLTPIRVSTNRAKDNSIQWVFKCKCGNEVEETPYRVLSGRRKSCNCIRYKDVTSRIKSHNPYHFNKEEEKFYRKWCTIRSRCYNKNHEKYKIYGAKGIKMCDEWENNPREFIKWCLETYPHGEKLTIDRIDGNGPYAPWNCRWATIKEQNRNKSDNVKVIFNGEEKILPELAEEYNIDLERLRKRLKNGWDIQRALTEPVNKKLGRPQKTL